MQKIANMQEQVGNLSKEMKILRKNKKKMNARDKKTVMEMKNIFDGHISRLDMAEKKSELKTVHYNLQNWKVKREKNWEKGKRASNHCRIITKSVTFM